MAPEVLEGAIQFSRDAFLKIDVYAMGLVLWELMSRTYVDEHFLDDTTVHDGQINVANQCSTESRYRAPFELELGPQPNKDQMCIAVTQRRIRPQPMDYWLKNQVSKIFT